MKNFKAFLLAGLLASVCSSRAELDINGKIEVIPIPERSHAAINFSGSSANDVDVVALDDAGNAAYAAPEPHSTPGNVVSNTLQNSLRNRAPDNFVPMRWTTVEGEEVVEYYAAAGLTTNGDLYFSLTSYGNAAELCGIRSARVIAGIPAYLSLPPPFVRDLRHVTLELDISGANESGYWGGGGGATDNSYSAYGGFFFLRAGGQFTIFDGTFKSQYQYQPWIGYRIPSAGSLQVVTANFAPNLANANGWALGNTVAGYWAGRAASPLLWNGQEVIPLPGYGVALNNSNDVLIASSEPGNDMAALLDRGNIYNRRPLRQAGSSPGLIPLPLQSQIRNIRPLHLSNRRTIAGTEIQPVLHIVFAAETLRDPGRDAWEPAVFVLRMLSNNTTDLYEIPGARNLNVRSINNTGLLAAIGTPAHQISKQALLLVPVDIAVDANRDGIIKFAGNLNNPALAGKPQDRTEEMKPFRFWINDDNDGDSGAGEEKLGTSRKDATDGRIKSIRDLEDFTRLHIHLAGLHDEIASGTVSVGLEWRNATGTPSIKVYQASEEDGGAQYLKTDHEASGQILGATATALGTVSAGAPFKFPASFWQADALTERPPLSADHPNRYLIFEGSEEGKGQLVLTFWSGSTWLGEGGSVWVDLVDVRKMYQSSVEDGFEKTHDETPQSIVFVHGWNMSPVGSRNFAETMFKRIWHRGFRGRFGYFRWNTDWSDAFDKVPGVGEAAEAYFADYNKSEYEAWRNGASQLKTFVEKLPKKYTRNIAAHSMGNIVAGSALAKGMKVTNYAMLQAALPASCLDDRAILQQNLPVSHSVSLNFWGIPVPLPTSITVWDQASPDGDADPLTQKLAYRGILKGIAKNCNPINFYLPNDNATSYAWEINNGVTKAPGEWANQYRYIPNNPLGKRLFKDYGEGIFDYTWSSRFESMSFAASSWGKAVGAEPRTEGAVPVGSTVNLGSPTFQLPTEPANSGFGKQHSGQFNANIQELTPFYERLLQALDTDFNNE